MHGMNRGCRAPEIKPLPSGGLVPPTLQEQYDAIMERQRMHEEHMKARMEHKEGFRGGHGFGRH